MKEISIDLETAGLVKESRILAIGACCFNRLTSEIYSKFYISLQPPVSNIKVIDDPKTLDWWDKQSKEAKEKLTVNPASYAQGLNSFVHWYKLNGNADTTVWGNDPSFDCDILEHSLKEVGLKAPWKFYMPRSIRTIVALASDITGLEPSEIKSKPETPHYALDDAIAQARTVSYAFSILRNHHDYSSK